MNGKTSKWFVAVCMLAAISLTGCGSSIDLASTWTDGTIVVDGQNSDWKEMPLYSQKEKFGLSVSNDNEFLYIYLATQDRQTEMQIMRFGLTVWLDRTDGKNESFGIRFPLGMPFSGSPMMERSRPEDPEALRQVLENQSQELEILGPGKNERRRLSILASPGIQAKLGYAGPGHMFYELRVPLKENARYPFAINTESSKIGIGLSTQVDREEMKERNMNPPEGGGRRGGEGGGGGFGGGMRGGAGRRGGGGSTVRPGMEPIDLWLSVTLAGKPSASVRP